MTDSENPEETFLSETTSPLVLVVDDDDAVREMLCDLLYEAGFAAIAAGNGLEALHVLANLQTLPTFILLDLTMPIMDGWAFCRSRWKSRTLRKIPVILISAVDISESNRPTGVDAFLPKPIDADEFARLAARVAGRKTLRMHPAELH